MKHILTITNMATAQSFEFILTNLIHWKSTVGNYAHKWINVCINGRTHCT